ncbi:DUF1015 family protein [Streptomyces sp. NPDC127084]|uniref:DUF1015 family protein n=1 Tax=Streptomyces sp. NPDC127084 TaxID=3347133 RepID=UPI0036539645
MPPSPPGVVLHPFRGVHPGPLIYPTTARPALYVQEQRRAGRLIQRGVIGALQLTASAGAVLPHEGVVPARVDFQRRLVGAMHGHGEPLLLTVRGGSGTEDVLDAVTSGPPQWTAAGPRDIAHTYWVIAETAQQQVVQRELRQRRALVADGHHRFAAAFRIREEFGGSPGPWDLLPALVVDSGRYPLRLAAIHRGIDGLDPVVAARRAAAVARVTPLGPGLRVPRRGEILLLGAGRGWVISEPRLDAVRRALAGRPPAWQRLDAAVLDELFIRDIWGVPDADASVRHVHEDDLGSPDELRTQACPAGGSLALLAPPAEEEVRILAESGVLMPRKSTSFQPKPLAWQLFHSFSD